MAWSTRSRCLCHVFGVLTFMVGFGSLISGVIWLAFYGDGVSEFTSEEFNGMVLVVVGVIVILWFVMYACFVKRRGWMLFACCEHENMLLPATLAKRPRGHQLRTESPGGAHQITHLSPGATPNILPPPIDYAFPPPPSSHGGTISVTDFYDARRMSDDDDEALERARAKIRMQVYNSANIYAIPVRGSSHNDSYPDDMF